MSRIAIRGATLLAAGRRPLRSDLFIEKGRIAFIGRQPRGFSGARRIDAAGLHAAPLLLDRMMAAPPSAEALAASAAGGSGNVLMTQAPARPPSHVRCHALAPLLDRDGTVGDLPAAARDGCCGFWLPSQAVHNSENVLRAMRTAAACDLPVVADPRIAQLAADAPMASGFRALRLGLAGMPEAAESMAVAMLIECAAEAGCRLHLAGVSCQRSLRFLAAAKAAGEPVTADVHAASLLLDDSDAGDFSMRHLLYPPLRPARHRKALAEALAEGIVDGLVTGHEDVAAERECELFAQASAGAAAAGLQLSLALEWASRAGMKPAGAAHAALAGLRRPDGGKLQDPPAAGKGGAGRSGAFRLRRRTHRRWQRTRAFIAVCGNAAAWRDRHGHGRGPEAVTAGGQPRRYFAISPNDSLALPVFSLTCSWLIPPLSALPSHLPSCSGLSISRLISLA